VDSTENAQMIEETAADAWAQGAPNPRPGRSDRSDRSDRSAEGHVVVVGGGIVGLATAWTLLNTSPGLRLTIVEKERNVGLHQSGHNSGVLHAGLSYAPGSVKALLARRGVQMMRSFCDAHGIAYELCGKLVVATHTDELARLDALFARGTANGLQGLRRLSPGAAREIEPNVACIAGLHVPEEGIVDYGAVCRALASACQERGGALHTSERVQSVGRRPGGGWTVQTDRRDLRASFLVNCAGLQVDRVMAMTGEAPPCRIVPFRGEYQRLAPGREGLVRHLIYPVPDPAFPFLGVHFTRRIAGGVSVGPNAILALAREGYHRSDLHLGDAADALGYPGLWRFLAQHGQTSVRELARSLSKRRYVAALQRLVPSITGNDLVPGGSGVRAQAMLPSGQLVLDFLLVERPHALHALNVPSPAATASLAIGQEIARRVGVQLARA